eukprot:scaffold12397_cov124-Isochrysis_galbana.AAC.7
MRRCCGRVGEGLWETKSEEPAQRRRVVGWGCGGAVSAVAAFLGRRETNGIAPRRVARVWRSTGSRAGGGSRVPPPPPSLWAKACGVWRLGRPRRRVGETVRATASKRKLQNRTQAHMVNGSGTGRTSLTALAHSRATKTKLRHQRKKKGAPGGLERHRPHLRHCVALSHASRLRWRRHALCYRHRHHRRRRHTVRRHHNFARRWRAVLPIGILGTPRQSYTSAQCDPEERPLACGDRPE